MRISLLLTALLVIVLTTAPQKGEASDISSLACGDQIPGQFIVKFSERATPSLRSGGGERSWMRQQYRAFPVDEVINSVDPQVTVLKSIGDPDTTKALLDEDVARGTLVYAEPDRVVCSRAPVRGRVRQSGKPPAAIMLSSRNAAQNQAVQQMNLSNGDIRGLNNTEEAIDNTCKAILLPQGPPQPYVDYLRDNLPALLVDQRIDFRCCPQGQPCTYHSDRARILSALKKTADGHPNISEIVSDMRIATYGKYSRLVTTADFNRDGLLDIVTVNMSTSVLSLHLSDPLGGANLTRDIGLTASFNLNSLNERVPSQTADIDGDGWLDIVIRVESTHVVLINLRSNQGFRQQQAIVGAVPSNFVTNFALARINADSFPDLVLPAGSVPHASPGFTYLLNHGDGTFGAPNRIDYLSLPGFDTHSIAAADYNQDNFDDIILVGWDYFSPGGIIGIVPGRDPNQFLPLSEMFLGPDLNYQGAHHLQSLDYDGDGDLDIFVPRQHHTGDPGTLFIRNLRANLGSGPLLQRLSGVDSTTFSQLTQSNGLVVLDPFAIAGARVTTRQRQGAGIEASYSDIFGRFAYETSFAAPFDLSLGAFLHRLPFGTVSSDQVSNGLFDLAAVRFPGAEPVPPATPPENLPNDEGMLHLWGLFNYGQSGGAVGVDIGAVEAWGLAPTREEVVVAVIDSGIDINHPDLVNQHWRNRAEIPGNQVDDDQNGVVDDIVGFDAVENDGDPTATVESHGSHVAGTIAAEGNNELGIVGVAPRSKIMTLRVFGDSGNTSDSVILGALNYVIEMRRRGVNIRAVNLSLGSPGACKTYYQEAFTRLNELNVVVVTAAGNDGSDNDERPDSPSGCDVPNNIAVAWLERTGNLAAGSNFGATKVHVAAPGGSVMSTYVDDGYQFSNGTSMAAPHVSGAVAHLAAVEPYLSAVQLRERLLSTAKPLPLLTGKIAVPGIINLAQAIRVGMLVFPAPGGESPPPGGGGSLIPGPDPIPGPAAGFDVQSIQIRVRKASSKGLKFRHVQLQLAISGQAKSITALIQRKSSPLQPTRSLSSSGSSKAAWKLNVSKRRILKAEHTLRVIIIGQDNEAYEIVRRITL